MYICKFCGYASPYLDDFEEDLEHQSGFWCPDCDGFTYYGKDERSYFLILEDKDLCEQAVSVPFSTNCSLLRYPGGKSRMVGKIFQMCHTKNLDCFAEPYAGGASVGLSLLLSGNVKELYLNDVDYGIYALFHLIIHSPDKLKERICSFVPTKESFYDCRSSVLEHYAGCSLEDAGWNLLVTNRLSFSGIPFANCLSDPCSRWNATTLCKRIDRISCVSEHIHLSNEDAVSYIENMYWKPNTTIFIDPPYYGKGKVLYVNSYDKCQHHTLSVLLDELHKGFPGADMIVTYDYQKAITDMYSYPEPIRIGRRYSI